MDEALGVRGREVARVVPDPLAGVEIGHDALFDHVPLLTEDTLRFATAPCPSERHIAPSSVPSAQILSLLGVRRREVARVVPNRLAGVEIRPHSQATLVQRADSGSQTLHCLSFTD